MSGWFGRASKIKFSNFLPVTPKRFIDSLASFISSVNQCTVHLLSSMAKIPNLDKGSHSY